MEKINWTRVVVGGLVAGLAVNALVLVPLAALQPSLTWVRGVPMAVGAVLVVMIFVVTILLVALYAANRSRYGAGIATAAMTGVVLGFVFCLLQYLMWVLTSRRIPVMVLATSGAVTFVAFLLATLVGAWVYEKPAP